MDFKAQDGTMVMSSDGKIIKFKNGLYSTDNKKDIALLSNCNNVSEIVKEPALRKARD